MVKSNRCNPIRHGVCAGLAAGLMLFASVAPGADSPCKGLERPQCENNGACTWVDAYVRKDGVKVDGYCRKKGGKKSSTN